MADDYHEYYVSVYGPEDEAAKGTPHGWIQWKGTDVCIDLHCACGDHGHVDADFFYGYECAHCGRKYAVGQIVRLIELTPEQVQQSGMMFQSDPQYPHRAEIGE